MAIAFSSSLWYPAANQVPIYKICEHKTYYRALGVLSKHLTDKEPCNRGILSYKAMLHQFLEWDLDRLLKTTPRGLFPHPVFPIKVVSFRGGSVIMWGNISLSRMKRFVIIEGNLNADRLLCWLSAITGIPLSLQSLILHDDQAPSHRVVFTKDYL